MEAEQGPSYITLGNNAIKQHTRKLTTDKEIKSLI